MPRRTEDYLTKEEYEQKYRKDLKKEYKEYCKGLAKPISYEEFVENDYHYELWLRGL